MIRKITTFAQHSAKVNMQYIVLEDRWLRNITLEVKIIFKRWKSYLSLTK
ncbi:MAG: hypothetical protein RBR28_00975 [Lentimicrobium sp.]|jgi:hypothetical protein|nr:hypothetical protein [Lentimicrobium sp.]